MSDLDLNISGGTCSINCRVSRWDVQDYSFIIETWLTKSQLQSLRNSIRPGSCRELYRILGKPRFVDSTWSASNTLDFTPASNSFSNLKNMRDGTTVGFVKTITTSPVNQDFIFVKLECYRSGSGSL